MPDPDGLELSHAQLAPSEAISYFRQKVNMPTQRWGELESAAHARGFAVAGATSHALLTDFKTAVSRALSNGTTLQEFRKTFNSIVKKHGWSHNGSPGWRAKIIYETNLASAYSAGRYRQMTTPAALELYPYWRYVHHACAHPRPAHVAWSGIILRNDDPWWATHYPPNGWRCHCTVEVVSAGRMERNGWKVEESPPVETRPWRNPATGKEEHVPVGIDPGFQSNQGLEWTKVEQARASTTMKPITHVNEQPVATLPAQEQRAVHRKQLGQFYDMEDKEAGNRPNGIVEAGNFHPAIQKLLDSKTASVLLSDDNIRKNIDHHPELGREDYEALADVLADPDYALPSKGDDYKLVLLYRTENAFYKVAVKTTRKRDVNFATSILRKSLRDLPQLLRNNDVLYEKK
ncbi:phage minor head protein [Bombella apis]|uniref:phage minor head protein n=1 Tax=Bombella apis TaxID=1785988 RepID=UPI0024A8DA59|nr:phage minor head protein [Bombella apis]